MVNQAEKTCFSIAVQRYAFLAKRPNCLCHFHIRRLGWEVVGMEMIGLGFLPTYSVSECCSKALSKACRSLALSAMIARMILIFCSLGELGIHSLMYPWLEYLFSQWSTNRCHCSSLLFSG